MPFALSFWGRFGLGFEDILGWVWDHFGVIQVIFGTFLPFLGTPGFCLGLIFGDNLGGFG